MKTSPIKVKRGQVVFWKSDMFPYIRWGVCTRTVVRYRARFVEINDANIVIPRHVLSKKDAAPIIEALDVLQKQEYAARHALHLGFIAKRDVIAPFAKSKLWSQL